MLNYWKGKSNRLIWMIGLILLSMTFLASLFMYLRWQGDQEKIAQSLKRVVTEQEASQKALDLPIRQELVRYQKPMILRQKWKDRRGQLKKLFEKVEKKYLQKWPKKTKNAPDLVSFGLSHEETALDGIRQVKLWAQPYRLKSLRYVADNSEKESVFQFFLNQKGERLTMEDLITSRPALASLIQQKLSEKSLTDSEVWLAKLNDNLTEQDFEIAETSLILWPNDEQHRLDLPYHELYDLFDNSYLSGEARVAYETYLAEKAEAERLARETAERAAAALRQQRVITKGQEGSGRVVALTFDDGPKSDTTPRILETLNAKGIKATFFVLGSAITGNEELLKTMSDQGHQIANHTWSHPNLTHLSIQQIQSEIYHTQEKIKAVTGMSPKVLRSPYGSYNSKVLEATDLFLVNWSVDTLDWKHRDKDSILARVKSQLSEGSIILMHDIHPTTADALPAVIDYLQAEGYTFVTINQLMGLD